MPLLTNPAFQQMVLPKITSDTGALRQIGLLAPQTDLIRDPWSSSGGMTYQMGESLGQTLEDKHTMEPIGEALGALEHSSGLKALLMSALVGGAAGAGMGTLTHRDPTTLGLLGAGVAGLGGYGLHRLMQHNRSNAREKVASYVNNEQDPMQYIQTRLFEDGSVGSMQKMQFSRQLSQLPPDALVTLAQILKSVAGGMVGYVVSKFLLGTGPVGSMLGAGAGAFLGGRTSLPRNTMDQSVNTHFDFFGQPRTV